MNIQFSESISEEDDTHLFHWRDQVFPIESKGIKWSQPTWHLLAANEGEQPSAHLGYGFYSIKLDGYQRVTVVGVGDVVVRPEAQGKRIPSLLFDYLHHSEHATSLTETFALFCPHRLESYYQQHGYKRFEGCVSFFQNNIATSTDKFVLMYRGKPFAGRAIAIECEPW
ncbi:GNAT family N-acetyltransferase [Marinomonas balearica]|uniref:Acetyltransferase (GNAT) family protein n=1 Tax=Marinomonas balearica TaxID=491947 RepID=A0A4R6MD12_9GAMM|nr:GNAT family N-acetyltransferase [Marinomonas balearica]TDO99568.1 acetyltransferase (GNAT) family protein [Marinomonas balearica]